MDVDAFDRHRLDVPVTEGVGSRCVCVGLAPTDRDALAVLEGVQVELFVTVGEGVG